MIKLRTLLGITVAGLALLVAGCASPRFPEPLEGPIVRYKNVNDGKFRYKLPVGDADAFVNNVSWEEKERELVQSLVFYKGFFKAGFAEYNLPTDFNFSIHKLEFEPSEEETVDYLY